jgi:hypothetical protein
MKDITKIIKLLNSNKVEVKLKYLKGLWGLCVYEDDELWINKRLCTPSQVTTLIHECLHYLYEENSEERTLELEAEVYKALTFDENNFLRDFLRSKE